MGLELPAELADVAAAAGVRWPEADEDAMREQARAWRDAAGKLDGLGRDADGLAQDALSTVEGGAADAARRHWDGFVAPDTGHLSRAVSDCHRAADRLENAAEQVGAAKTEIVRQLAGLAQQRDAAEQAASAGHPNARLGLDTVVRGVAANVAAVHDTLTKAVQPGSGVSVAGMELPAQPPEMTSQIEKAVSDVMPPGLPNEADRAGDALLQTADGVDETVDGALRDDVPGVGRDQLPDVGRGQLPDIGRHGVDDLSPGVGGTERPPSGPPVDLSHLDAESTGPIPVNAAGGPPVSQVGPVDLGGPAPHGPVPPGAVPQIPPGPAPGQVPSGPAQVTQAWANMPPGPPAPPVVSAEPGPAPAQGTPAAPGVPGPAGGLAGTAAAGPHAPAAPVAGGTPAGSAGGPNPAVAQKPAPGPWRPVGGADLGNITKHPGDVRGAPPQAPAPGVRGPVGSSGGAPQPGVQQPPQAGIGHPAAPAPQPNQSLPPGQFTGMGQAGLPAPGSFGAAPSTLRAGGFAGAVEPLPIGEPARDVDAGRTNRAPRNETVIAFLLHQFPIGYLPKIAIRPARQLQRPEPDEDYAPGLRFPPQDHPRSGLVVDHAALARVGTGAPPAMSAGLPAGHAVVAELVGDHDPLGGQHERDWERRFVVRPGAEGGRAEYNWPPSEMFPEGGSDPGGGEPVVLAEGTLLDRFGRPDGRVLSAAGTPFSARSLPPEYLARGYHRYRVLRPLPVWRALSAPWFGQPGGGERYRATYAVAELVAMGYLAEIGEET
ncbi:hypothetical protein GCM10012275_40920 [Longimycelium tulufanense]|uniref:DUF4237 domain-containing protein n=1 Tax=Longimycelium tulufanense TaxID=907463 RepID=A0A8J3FVT5_9PSEU|nr:TNT domain-containing protein [Longimycelium tulufanense]GGM66163.1 hypothetical protein GCM10012275_40920 [Longimycelium tulufanense]